MKKNNVVYSIVSIAMAVALGIIAANITIKIREQTSYAVDISALIVSFIALVISIVTYFSIDKVNNITSMSGNVLENSTYSVATSELVNEFNGCNNDKDFTKELLDSVSHPKNGNPIGKTKSIIEFADLIQNFIDHLIWFAYIDDEPDTYKKKEEIVKDLEKNLEKYEQLSNGIQYLLKENLKLIQYVLLYQDSTRNNTYERNMENIRGRMMTNPVSQIVYYDYYGLCRRRQAKRIMRSGLPEYDDDEFSANNMIAILKHDYKKDETEKIIFFLDQAMKWFNKADKLTDDDILWKSYISYNKVRTKIQRLLILKDTSDQSMTVIKQDLKCALDARMAVCILYGEEDNYLSQKFSGEYKYTEELFNNFIIVEDTVKMS